MIIKKFENNTRQYFVKTYLTISIKNDKLVCDILQKNYIDNEEHEFSQKVEKNTKILN
jgi:hypothetical protein